MDNTVRVWDVRPYAPQDRCIKKLYGHAHNFEKNLLRVDWSPQGDLISAGSADKFLYIWDFESGKINYKLPGHNGSINDIAFHPMEEISKIIRFMSPTQCEKFLIFNNYINCFLSSSCFITKLHRHQVTKKSI
jgi:WD40 repeat protein